MREEVNRALHDLIQDEIDAGAGEVESLFPLASVGRQTRSFLIVD